jgi:hypothetical protein
MTATKKRYTIEEANALVPAVRSVLLQLAVQRRRYAEAHAALHELVQGDADPGQAEDVEPLEAAVAAVRADMEALGEHLTELGIEIRDLEMGLVDFPGERDGQPVWLCWRLADPSVAFWHTNREGFANRRPW